jgi:hypothetical protein
MSVEKSNMCVPYIRHNENMLTSSNVSVDIRLSDAHVAIGKAHIVHRTRVHIAGNAHSIATVRVYK